jgi:hypothetical protein
MLDLSYFQNQNSNVQGFFNGGTWQTWVKPRGAKMVNIICVGSGAGGGGGFQSGSAPRGGGGGGGGGGSPAIIILTLTFFLATARKLFADAENFCVVLTFAALYLRKVIR